MIVDLRAEPVRWACVEDRGDRQVCCVCGVAVWSIVDGESPRDEPHAAGCWGVDPAQVEVTRDGETLPLWSVSCAVLVDGRPASLTRREAAAAMLAVPSDSPARGRAWWRAVESAVLASDR